MQHWSHPVVTWEWQPSVSRCIQHAHRTLVRMTVTSLEEFTTPATAKLSPETFGIPLLYLGSPQGLKPQGGIHGAYFGG